MKIRKGDVDGWRIRWLPLVEVVKTCHRFGCYNNLQF